MIKKTATETRELLKHNLIEYGQYDYVKIRLNIITCVLSVEYVNTNIPSVDLDTLISINSAIADTFPKEELSNIEFIVRDNKLVWEIPCKIDRV